MEKMMGGDVIARMLKAEGVEKVFGIIDGTYFGLYSSLRKYGIDLVTPRHETSAAHMAGAYARITGKIGVCMASNGPGVANILPGVAVENGEGNRVLLLTSTRRIGTGYPDRGGTYQYFNQVGVIKPMSKWSGAVASHARLPELLRRAFRKSFQGRPGVVHLDVPENIMNGEDTAPAFLEPHQYRRTEPIAPSLAQVEAAADLLLSADLPIIHAGSGVIHASAFEELRELAELLQAPVLTSWAARSALPEDHPLAISMIHVELNHRVRNDADVVLVLGSRLGETDWWGKAPYWRHPSQQKMVQVDIDEDILGLNKPATIAVMSDCKAFLRALIDAIKSRKSASSQNGRATKLAQYADARTAHLKTLRDRLEGPGLNAGHVATACEQHFGKDAICVIDGGNTAIWAHFYRKACAPNTVLQTAKFGMLGAGVAQVLGAKIAAPDRPAFCIIGDGAMGFQMQEIETAVRNKLAVTYLVCCDRQWGMVKMNQQFTLQKYRKIVEGLSQKFTSLGALNASLGPLDAINADLNEIQWDKLAESMGAHGERINSPEQLKPALQRASDSQKCSVIQCDVDPVAHMWAPSLRAFKDMHQEPAGR